MWSFGCIIHEILQYVVKDPNESTKSFQKKDIYFKEIHAFPCHHAKQKKKIRKMENKGILLEAKIR
jgi:hypothetical protein